MDKIPQQHCDFCNKAWHTVETCHLKFPHLRDIHKREKALRKKNARREKAIARRETEAAASAKAQLESEAASVISHAVTEKNLRMAEAVFERKKVTYVDWAVDIFITELAVNPSREFEVILELSRKASQGERVAEVRGEFFAALADVSVAFDEFVRCRGYKMSLQETLSLGGNQVFHLNRLIFCKQFQEIWPPYQGSMLWTEEEQGSSEKSEWNTGDSAETTGIEHSEEYMLEKVGLETGDSGTTIDMENSINKLERTPSTTSRWSDASDESVEIITGPQPQWKQEADGEHGGLENVTIQFRCFRVGSSCLSRRRSESACLAVGIEDRDRSRFRRLSFG